MRIKLTFILLIVLILFSQYVFADELLDRGIQKIKEKNYPVAIGLLEEACPVLETDEYDPYIWKCNFNIAYAYERMASISIDGEEIGYLKIHKPLLDKARYHYEKAINISKLNTGDVQLSDAIFLAHIEVSTENHEKAFIILSDLETRMNSGSKCASVIDILKANESENKEVERLKQILGNLITSVIKDFKVSLIKTNIGPFGFTYFQIDPQILFQLKRDIPFYYILHDNAFPESISFSYKDINGIQSVTLPISQNEYSKIQNPILLEPKGIFPFDKFETVIFNVNPPVLFQDQISLSIEQSSPYDGQAIIDKEKILIQIKRNNLSIIFFYIFFILTVIALIILNKSIKNMDYRSFKFSNLIKRRAVLFAIFSFLFTLVSIYDWISFFNFYIYILIIGIFISFIHITFRYKKLKR